jgi:hypothetical protein
MKSRLPLWLFIALTVIGVGRIVATWSIVSQTVDETPNIACGMQWLDKGLYDYGPFHPPLARIALAIGPYLYGARAQGLPDRWKEGNAVLNSARRPDKALKFARAGILPFFIVATVMVWLWSRRLWGEWGALASVFAFTNLPVVLGHSGIATTDMAVAAGVVTGLYAFTRWLDDPTPLRSVLLGLAMAFAFLGKFSSVVFLGVSIAVMVVLYVVGERRMPRRIALLGISAVVMFFAVWSFYRFSFGKIREPLVEDATSQGGLMARVPVPLLKLLSTTPIPMPEIPDGLWIVHEHNLVGHAAYLLGEYRKSGWWYFFPVALAVKSPIAFLLLVATGFALLGRFDWRRWAPALCAAAMFAACMPARLNIGLRYLLPMFPLLAIVAGGAVAKLWQWRAGRAAAVVLLAWLGIAAALAHPDYIAYFNEAASHEPERFLVDSDLDWGQDVKRLSRKLKELKVQQVYLALHYSGDDSRLDLPPWEGLNPYEQVKGWVGISYTRMKTLGAMVAADSGKTEPGFAWLEQYKPVTRVGKSILLYYIP